MKLRFTLRNKQKKIRNLSFKNYYFGPPKKRVFGLFFVFGFDSALKTKDELLKSLKPPKQSKWLFWWLKAFFSAFSKIPTKRSFVCLLFLKLNQSRNMKKQFFGGFSSKTKNALFRVPKFGFGLLKSYMTHTVHCTLYSTDTYYTR